MLQQSARMVGLLSETQLEIDIRAAPRFGCPTQPTLRIMVRPSFIPVNVKVHDISAKGIGLVSEKHLESGACLAVLWKYGTADRWRTLRARVVRLTPRRDGNWVAGCVFAEPLLPDDMEAFLRLKPARPSMFDD
jgi:PilZ domain